MATKYEPLRRWLELQSTNRLRVTFGELEQVLGFKLPRSARELAQWWANVRGSHVQASAWMDAGWRTCFNERYSSNALCVVAYFA